MDQSLNRILALRIGPSREQLKAASEPGEPAMHAHRVNAYTAVPAAMKALQAVEIYLHQSGLDKNLIDLVKMRASQINGCAYCLDMHSKELRRDGETEQRIYL